MTIYSKSIRLLPLFGVLSAIFYFSHLPGTSALPLLSSVDKLLHVLAYSLLAAACLPVRLLFSSIPERRFGIMVVLFSILYGISDELHQSFIPGRTPSGWDVAADGLGAVLMILLWLTMRR